MIFYIFLRSRARPHGKWLYAGLAVFYDALPHCDQSKYAEPAQIVVTRSSLGACGTAGVMLLKATVNWALLLLVLTSLATVAV